jgi:predicted transglutaminase-like cysteine proteinase
MRPVIFLVATALAVVVGSVLDAQAAQDATSALAVSQFAPVEDAADKPLLSWLDYCRRYSDDCTIDLSEPTQVKLTPHLLDEIRSINLLVNTTVVPETDLEHWGVMDHWDQAEDGYGDCEDYQLLKRALLVKAGVPRRALLMTVVLDAQGEGHALLMIRTNKGDYILDNLTDSVLPWSKTGYVFVKRESQYFVGWVRIDMPVGQYEPALTARRQ